MSVFDKSVQNLGSGGTNLAGTQFTQSGVNLFLPGNELVFQTNSGVQSIVASGTGLPVSLVGSAAISGTVGVIGSVAISGSVGILGPVAVSGTVRQVGAANLATNQVSVGTTSTQIVGSRSLRRDVIVTNQTNTDTWVGQSGVTATNGQLLVGVKGASVDIPFNGVVHGVVLSGSTGSVSYLEVYD